MGKKVYIAPGAVVVGDVVLEDQVSIWYNAVLRGDRGRISIGERSNVQDNCTIHEGTTVGKGCSIGHNAILHGCTVGDNCVIGMGAIVLNGAVLGEHCLVGAGAVVTGKMNAPDGSLIVGNPAKVVKEITPELRAEIEKDAALYLTLSRTL